VRLWLARSLILAALLGLFVSACGGGGGQVTPEAETETSNAPTSSSADISANSGADSGVEDACVLLSTDELAAAVGGTWGEPRNVPGGQSVECDYVDDETRSKFFVAVYSQEAVAAAGGAEAMMESLAYGATGTELDIGDGAIFYSSPNIRNFVVMQSGGAVVQISGETPFGLAFDQEAMATIAQAVVEKLD
jgi:hypothetical protein